jgi:hypothetical protein
MRIRVYLDTSVLSALHDDRVPERRSATSEFWGRLSEIEASTSSITRLEIDDTVDAIRRARMIESLAQIALFEFTAEMDVLARRYIAAAIFTPTMIRDAQHVAAAVLTRQDVLLSWNFRHLVNRKRRGAVQAMNIAAGLPSVDIIAPPEL